MKLRIISLKKSLHIKDQQACVKPQQKSISKVLIIFKNLDFYRVKRKESLRLRTDISCAFENLSDQLIENFIEAVGSLDKVRVNLPPEYSQQFQNHASRIETYFAYLMLPSRQVALIDRIVQVRT